MPYGKNVILNNLYFVINNAGAFVIIEELPTTKIKIDISLEEYNIIDILGIEEYITQEVMVE